MKIAFPTLAVLLITGLVASAAPVTPTFDSFGTLSSATFGGSGIPNNAVAITTINDGDNTITLGLTAFGRFDNVLKGNNGAGVFYASPGANYGDPNNPTTQSPSHYLGATWDFGFYIDSTSQSYQYQLTIFTPSGYSSFNPLDPSDNGGVSGFGGQNSENLMFSDFGGVHNGAYSTFNADAAGQYGFVLSTQLSNGKMAQSAIVVDVASVPDIASTALLLGLGLAGLVGFGLRQKRLQPA